MGERVTETPMVMDPTEILLSGSITGLLKNDFTNGLYLPFSFGGSQSIVSQQVDETKVWEIIGEIGAFTQFGWKTVAGQRQRNLLNVDYRIAFSYIRKVSETVTYKIRGFHVSSHIGDDFIFRNEIREPTTNKVNYEQIDFTYFKKMEDHFTLYGGIGSVTRLYSLRLPLSVFVGGQKDFKKEGKNWAWTFCGNFKSFQETQFNPNLKLAIGRAYFTKAKPEPVRLVLEYYNGHLPYSQYERIRTEWLGAGIYFYL